MGLPSVSYIQDIQRFQNKVIKWIVNEPWFIRDSELYWDFQMELVSDIIHKFSNSHQMRFQNHINIEAYRVLDVQNITRRLKRTKPFELTKWFAGKYLSLIN